MGNLAEVRAVLNKTHAFGLGEWCLKILLWQLCILCVSVVIITQQSLTTETQKTQR